VHKRCHQNVVTKCPKERDADVDCSLVSTAAFVITARGELRRVMFLALSVCGFFVCVWNISGTAERICAKFTRKTCLVPRSDEFEGQGHGQRWRSPGTKMAFSAACMRFMFGKTPLASSWHCPSNIWHYWLLQFQTLIVQVEHSFGCVGLSVYLNNDCWEKWPLTQILHVLVHLNPV